jgi:hypothetical protein
MNERTRITLAHPDEVTRRILAAAETHPVHVECDGVIYRIEREDQWLGAFCYQLLISFLEEDVRRSPDGSLNIDAVSWSAPGLYYLYRSYEVLLFVHLLDIPVCHPHPCPIRIGAGRPANALGR